MKVSFSAAASSASPRAYYLAKAGHEVTVIDRQPGPALETSFANAGEVSPGYSSPWAAPGIPLKAMKWLLMRHAPLIVRPAIDRAMLGWMFEMLRNCTSARYAVNKSAHGAASPSTAATGCIELRAETGIAYDERSQGTLQLFRTQKQLDGVAKDVEVLKQVGVPFEVLDAAGCIAAEPALGVGARQDRRRAAPAQRRDRRLLHVHQPPRRARRRARRHLPLRHHHQRPRRRRRPDQRRRDHRGDARRPTPMWWRWAAIRRTCCAPLGMHLPVYPMKGYSITVPIVDAARAPESTIMDETYKIAITRLGDRIRVGGMAEISGYDNCLPERRRATLEHSRSTTCSRARGDTDAASFWSGLRPMTPDGTPVIGATPYANLFLNTGHGTLGLDHGVRLGACDFGHRQRPAARHRVVRPGDRALRRPPGGQIKEGKFMTIRRIDSDRRMSQAVIHGNTVYLSGQVGAPGESVTLQTQAVLAAIESLLAEVGTDKSKLLQCTIWLADMADFAEMNQVWDAWIGGKDAPARATGEAKLAAPEYKVEIIAVAAID